MSRHEGNSTFGSGQAFEFALGDELRGERATKGKTLLDVQRDLRIQAAYISAIEDGTVDAFPNPSFIPGYVRSYARYLTLDPDVVYRRFCAEHGFTNASVERNAASAPGKGAAKGKAGADIPSFQPKFPLSEPRGNAFSGVQVSAIGSLLVLVALIGGLGYGGWTVLQNIQRVQFAPIEDVPVAMAEVDPITEPDALDASGDAQMALNELATPVASTSLSDLYRQEDRVVPILAPRDGPIAAINPDDFGPLRTPRVDTASAAPVPTQPGPGDPYLVPAPDGLAATVAADAQPDPRQAEGPGLGIGALVANAVATQAEAAVPAAPQPLAIVAERAAWIRVYLDNGTIIFESILEKGESYTPPQGVGTPLIWAGNSGSVYVRLGETLHGPLGQGTRAVRDVVLDPIKIVQAFEAVEAVPEVISQRIAPQSTLPVPAVAIQ